MRTFIVIAEDINKPYKPVPSLYLEESFISLLNKLNTVYKDSLYIVEGLSEEALAEHLNYSNGDGDIWYSISEVINGDELKVWLN